MDMYFYIIKIYNILLKLRNQDTVIRQKISSET